MKHVADLRSLSEFFGAEPKIHYPELPIEQNVVEFEAEVGGTNVWFRFCPPAASGELRVRGTPFSVVKLTLTEMTHISLRKTAEGQYMHIRFASSNTKPLHLHLRSCVILSWGNGAESKEESRLDALRDV
jgi:hypothetical protein